MISASRPILVVEDRDALRKLVRHTLEQEGYRVTAASAGDEAISRLERGERFSLVLSDLRLPGADGLEVLAASREHQPEVPVVVLTAFGTVATAVKAMKLGAVDFLEKPVELDELIELARGLMGTDDGAAVFQCPGGPPIVGRHPTLRAALRLLRKVAPTDSTVLLTGSSGTGKELFARTLHGLSPRAENPFVAVNCAAIPETLMENELFGHEKGAFTGAGRRQAGRFELAADGTLFLDEIGELDLSVQGKVLRVLEERTFERVGGGRSLRSRARVVAATNRDLAEMVAEGSFRQDLFYRLDVFPIELPALAERRSDIALLAQHLTRQIAERHGRPAPKLTSGALEALGRAPWPGNVRQLANLLERAIILDESDQLTTSDLASLLGPEAPTEADEDARIRQALQTHDGDKKAAAAALGWSYRNLQRKVRQYDLEGFPKYRD